MEYTTLGPTGLTVSRLGLGTARFGRQLTQDRSTSLSEPVIDYDEAHSLLDAAHSHGINYIDTANTYGRPHEGRAERWIGDWLDGHDRDRFVIASKVYGDMSSHPNDRGTSRKHVRTAVEGSLDRLGTEYLDIYYLHRWDESTPIRETLRTLDDLVSEGKVHYLGMSVTAAWRLTKALWASDANGLEAFTVTQPRYNAIDRPRDYLDVCAHEGIAVCPFSPLAGGFLTGKYDRETSSPEGSRGDRNDWSVRHSERDWEVLDTVRRVANDVDATPLQVSLRWLMEHDRFSVVPIIGARTVDQLSENVGAVDISLSRAQRQRITEVGATTDQEG